MPGYQKAILTHIDIMGFRDLIDQSKANQQKVGQIASTLRGIRRQFLEGGRQKGKGKPSGRFDAINFSDLTVRVTYVDSESSLLDCLDWELSYLVTKQFDLAVGGVLIRGGLSLGDIYVEDAEALVGSARIIFGPALVSAYNLESTIATFPRIAIDPALMVEVRKSPDKITLDHIRRGEDGVYFVDYLYGMCESSRSSAADIDQNLELHREAVINKLEQLKSSDSRIRQKILWLALYHNSTIARLNGPRMELPVPPPDPNDLLGTPAVSLNFDVHAIDETLINQPDENDSMT